MRCCITVPGVATAADLKAAADYEALLRKKFVGVPDDWIPTIAQQAAAATPSPAGRRKLPATLQGLAWVVHYAAAMHYQNGSRKSCRG
jgi:hypothetical protein